MALVDSRLGPGACRAVCAFPIAVISCGEKMIKEKIFAADALNKKYRSYLRFVEPSDAEFIGALRSDPSLNRFLNPSSADIQAQKKWIKNYKNREMDNLEYYFVICCDEKDFGVVRMYDFHTNASSFSWGSWIILPSRPEGLVTFSAIMIYEIGFDVLQFSGCHFQVRKGNRKVTAFHERAGAVQIGEDDDNLYLRFQPRNYVEFRQKSFKQILVHRTDVFPRFIRASQ